ncbi:MULTISPECIES: hypothetical protein [Pseudomonas]|uniref:DUF3077 domain-containing protein n=1 Tax=Pseudomonas entomophila TaxID=312306 RepID=A0A3Q8U391_9PSED|nr:MULTISPECIES: hypothetical protein [Pseudomonas]AZL70516.1 hypothetical protein EJA05_23515 [Pseudomonas oryziphila]UVL88479.1 hypothetical protein LOY51_22370 [Pseudomonas sichuanensis]
MKKIVPDPPYPIPFITIINDLTAEQAMAHAATLMDPLVDTVHAYADCPPELRSDILLDNASVLTQLVIALINHAKSKRAAHER